MELRDRLQQLDAAYHDVFVDLVERLSPLLTSIADQFPEYTRHDPSHNQRLEVIAADLLKPELKEVLTAADLFTLLCALWLHDAGLGIYKPVALAEQRKAAYLEKLARFERLGRPAVDCWREYVRENHHHFCTRISHDYLSGQTSEFLIHWIGLIGQSHGERQIHDRTVWRNRVAISESENIRPPLLAAVVRLADILHFGYERAPDYMLEHRHIENILSVSHWRAHQVAAGYTIDNDICYFHGVTEDDEAYWFAQQFFDAMESELKYCKADVFSTFDRDLVNPLTFSQIERGIIPDGFVAGPSSITLRVEAPKLLEDLLNDALYAGKPAWFRELLQNAFDACRDRSVQQPESHPSIIIESTTEPERIVFTDTGIGMRRRTVEHFLLVAGASFWSSAEYRSEPPPHAGHVGRFGIGFMSVFAVADEVTVETRHIAEPHGWRFLIRSPRRVVRVERIDRDSGTTVILSLKSGTLAIRDPADLLSDVCTYPEFGLSLFVDGLRERHYPTGLVPTPDDDGFALCRTPEVQAEARLIARTVVSDGLCGAFQLPKIVLSELGGSVPNLRGWVQRAGWEVTGESKTFYGGITYPSLHALNSPWGFQHIPSIGVMRVAVSPNRYPLEMNLARDNFANGDGTRALFLAITGILDGFLADDLETELSRHGDPAIRSALAAFHSWTFLHLWTGQVPSFSHLAHAAPSAATRAIDATPWPRITRTMELNLMLHTIDQSGTMRRENLASLVDSGAMVVAGGAIEGSISEALLMAIFTFAPEARILIGLPDPSFGIIQMRHWAAEEFLIPVPEHGRSAFGLRLARSARPFAFFPRETEHLGIPVASGPPEYAVLDYRDLMAEVAFQPTGSSQIVAVLNRRNDKIAKLLEHIGNTPDANVFRRSLGSVFKQWRTSLILGYVNHYTNEISSLIGTLNTVGKQLGSSMEPIEHADVPTYMARGAVTPFGRSLLDAVTIRAHREISRYDNGLGELA